MQLKKSGPNWQIEKVLYSIITMQGHTYLWSLGENYWSLVGMFCHIHHIILTLHHPIIFYFDLYKTPWMVKISITMMISNRTWFSFLLIKTTSFMNVGSWCSLKDGKRSLIKMGNTLQNKVPWKNCLWFSKKNPQLLSCQPNILYYIIWLGEFINLSVGEYRRLKDHPLSKYHWPLKVTIRRLYIRYLFHFAN